MKKLKESLASAQDKVKIAINTVVVANRLQDLNEGFNKYLEHKRGDEPTFKVRQSMNPNGKVPKLDSEEGKPFDTFYSLGELVSCPLTFPCFRRYLRFSYLSFHAFIARRRRLRFSIPSNSQEATIRKVRL